MSKREKIFDGITDIRDGLVQEGAGRPRRRRWHIPAVAACLVVALVLTAVLRPDTGLVHTAYALRLAEYPEMPRHPELTGLSGAARDAAYDLWSSSLKAQRREGYQQDLTAFLEAAVPALLSGGGTENLVCSPLNIYMALAMLAESADGASRQQILDLLGAPDLESLRGTADDLWNAHYRDDGIVTSILGSSVWLHEELKYNEAVLDTLAERYHASSFSGKMGDPDYDAALQSWLNEQTGGLLEGQISDISLDPNIALALAATVCFRAKWADEFNAGKTAPDIFHSPAGDVTAEYMHSFRAGNYYWSDKFGAVRLGLETGGLWLLLPDEGYTPADLLGDPVTLDFILRNGGRENCKTLQIDLALPKFDAVSQLQLKEPLQALGVTEIFDRQKADFALVEEAWLGQAQHGARVAVDEEGLTAAAYTILPSPGAMKPPEEEMAFTLDRPFLFVVESADGLPLFTGIVNHP